MRAPPPRKSEFGPKDDPKNLVHLSRKLHEVTELYHLRRLQEAARLGQEILAERPDMGIAYSYVTQVLLEMGQTSQAITLMEPSMDVDRIIDLVRAKESEVGEDIVLTAMVCRFASDAEAHDSVESFSRALSSWTRAARESNASKPAATAPQAPSAVIPNFFTEPPRRKARPVTAPAPTTNAARPARETESRIISAVAATATR